VTAGPGGARRLIVNADDFGQSPGINRGVLDAVDYGIVTSASLMVRWPAAGQAVRAAKARPRMSLGLHVDLGEWAVHDGNWVELYRVVDPSDTVAAEDELARQLETFARLVGSPPTHLDSHQHHHREEPLRSLMLNAADRLGVPLRDESPSVQYSGAFYGQYGAAHPYPEGITVEALMAIFDTLPEGTTELGCHPGSDDRGDVSSSYRAERRTEQTTLCDPTLPRALADRAIQLCSFAEV
jgi:predicted glycoside hydrolase/deacetylase ChbG (UPF0249 family)